MTLVVDELEARTLDAALERSARVRYGDTALRLRIAVPLELAGDPVDASPFLPLCLLSAMRTGSDLVVDAAASPRLVRGLTRARELYRAWSPPLHESDIRVAELREVAPRGEELACFFSRGVDSTYSAAVPRQYPGELTRLIFIEGFAPEHDDEVGAEEVRRAGIAAHRIGLPLSVVSTNFYELAARTIGNADDHTAAGLAVAALALGGGIAEVLVPSSDSTQTLGPFGSNPALDPLFATEAVGLEYDSPALGRVQKGLWIARERPDLLAQLKVCFENRPDNCGRCPKCVLTMATLVAAGKLGEADQFPAELSPAAVAHLHARSVQPRVEMAELMRALATAGEVELLGLVRDLMARPQRPYPGTPPRDDTPDFRARHSQLLTAAVRDGLPWPPERDIAMPPGAGLVRVLDRRRARHVYGIGHVPEGELVEELGRVPLHAAEGLEPLWVTSGGRLTTAAGEAGDPKPRVAGTARFVLAPLAWRDIDEPAGKRVRASLERLARLRGRRAEPGARVGVVGHLHRHPADGRLPLYSAVHPVTGDQLLTTNAAEPGDMGYGPGRLLGYVDGDTPLTGRLHADRPLIPWASRFGQRVRET